MLNMRKGGRRLVVIPPGLAYGSQGVPNRVPPDSTLVFEAEIRRVSHNLRTSLYHGSLVPAVFDCIPICVRLLILHLGQYLIYFSSGFSKHVCMFFC